MKKLILLWLLFFSIFPTIKESQLSFTTTQICNAQEHGNPDQAKCPRVRTSIWDWLVGIVRAIASTITDFINFLDDSFDTGGSGGGSNNEPAPDLPSLYTTWAVTYSSATTIPQDPVFSGGGGGGYTINTNLQTLLNQNMEWPDPPPGDPVYDCENVANGRAFMDDCGTCVGGYTALIPCYIPPPRFDTVVPISIPCPDTNSVNRNTRLNSILNTMESKTEMQDLRSGLNTRKFEVGFTINQNSSTTPPQLILVNYSNSGTSRSVNLPVYPSSAACVHTHPVSDSLGNTSIHGPSVVDMMLLLDNWNSFNSRKYFADFVISGGANPQDYAITVADTNLLKQFYLQNPYATVIDTRDSIGVNGNMVLNLQRSNWKGNKDDPRSLFRMFMNIYDKLKNDNYPRYMIDDYANMIMMQQLNMGIKMHRKVAGQFKELSFTTEIDSQGKLHYKINICQ